MHTLYAPSSTFMCNPWFYPTMVLRCHGSTIQCLNTALPTVPEIRNQAVHQYRTDFRGQSWLGMVQILCKCSFKLAHLKEKVHCSLNWWKLWLLRMQWHKLLLHWSFLVLIYMQFRLFSFDIHFHFDSNWHCNLRLLNDPWIMSEGKKMWLRMRALPHIFSPFTTYDSYYSSLKILYLTFLSIVFPSFSFDLPHLLPEQTSVQELQKFDVTILQDFRLRSH